MFSPLRIVISPVTSSSVAGVEVPMPTFSSISARPSTLTTERVSLPPIINPSLVPGETELSLCLYLM